MKKIALLLTFGLISIGMSLSVSGYDDDRYFDSTEDSDNPVTNEQKYDENQEQDYDDVNTGDGSGSAAAVNSDGTSTNQWPYGTDGSGPAVPVDYDHPYNYMD